MDLKKIPSKVSATFATDRLTYSEYDCISYISDTSNNKPSLTNQQLKRWKGLAVFLTVFTTLFSLSFSALFFYLSSEMDSSSTVAMGIDAFFAVFGAGFVLWRLHSQDDDSAIAYREKAGSLFFGAAFVVSGAITFVISTYRIFQNSHPSKPVSVVIALAVFIIISGMLTFALYKVARKLYSSILVALATDTLFAFMLSLGVFVTELIYMETIPRFWFLDDAVTIFISFFFVLCGVNLLTKVALSMKKQKPAEKLCYSDENQ